DQRFILTTTSRRAAPLLQFLPARIEAFHHRLRQVQCPARLVQGGVAGRRRPLYVRLAIGDGLLGGEDRTLHPCELLLLGVAGFGGLRRRGRGGPGRGR